MEIGGSRILPEKRKQPLSILAVKEPHAPDLP
jgi:hypothetical protein